jgi:hypothetical protein
VLGSPSTCLPPFEEALEEFIRNRSPKVRCRRGMYYTPAAQGTGAAAAACMEFGQAGTAGGGSIQRLRAQKPCRLFSTVPAPLLVLLLLQLLEEAQRVHIAFNGEFGPHTVTPRLLTSEVRVEDSWRDGSSTAEEGQSMDCLLTAVLPGRCSSGCSIMACVR